MAKLKVVCKDYTDMENLMVSMDRIDRRLGAVQAELDSALKGVDRLKQKAKDLLGERKPLLAAMEKYAVTRKGLDFTGEGESRRQKILKRGVVGFRLTPPSVKTLSRDWTESKCVDTIEELVGKDTDWRKLNAEQLVRIKKTLNKPAIIAAEIPEDGLAKAGLQIVQDDEFWAKTACEMEQEQQLRDKKPDAA